MSFLSLLLVAIGLSFDCFAIAVASGFILKEKSWGYILRIALIFGAFHIFMPLAGWLLGAGLKNVISEYDHWVAFTLLVAIGIKMIWEGINGIKKEDRKQFDPTVFLVLLTLSFASSIDALVVGISLALLNISIILAALIIGTITFIISFAGGYTGKLIGHKVRFPLLIPGGFVLIGIGIKILLEHLNMF
ncbi:MAG: manganese efflux pump MntP family protein [Bacteroidota bacterium]